MRPDQLKPPSLQDDGYEIHREWFAPEEIRGFCLEADAVARAAGSACVRHLRERSALFRDLALTPRILQLVPDHLVPVRSILFDKTPDENWPVPWHQDLTIAVAEERNVPGYGPWSRKDGTVHVQPPAGLLQRMATVRIHLDDTPSENGALRMLPGSHLFGKIPSGMVASHVRDPIVTCECRPGDTLVMSPLILHSSRKSLNPARRRILHFEYARAEDLDPSLGWHEAGV